LAFHYGECKEALQEKSCGANKEITAEEPATVPLLHIWTRAVISQLWCQETSDLLNKEKGPRNMEGENMKICPSCGFKGDEDTLFCEECGTKMVDMPEESSADIPSVESTDGKPDSETLSGESSQDGPSAEAAAKSSKEEISQDTEAPQTGEANAACCPNCGTPITDADCMFCENCGAPMKEAGIQGADNAIPQAVPDDKEKKGRSKIVPVVIIVLAVVVVAGIILLFTKGGKGGAKAAVYVKNGEYYYNSLKNNADSFELTDNLSDESDVAPSMASSYLYLTEDGRKLFYPDDFSTRDYTFTLYYCDPTRPDDDPVKIDKDVAYYNVSENEDGLIYCKGSYSENQDLYYYDFKDKTKIDTDIISFRISKDAKQVIYIDEDRKLFRKEVGKDKEKIDSDVSGISYVSDDFSTVYYSKLDDDVLYRCVQGKDKERLIKDVRSVISITEDGCVYYYGNCELDLKNLISDEKKAADAAFEIPEEPEYPSWTDKNYDKLYEQYEKDWDAYMEALDEYYNVQSRDAVREQLAQAIENNDLSTYVCSLYCFDGQESTLLAEAVSMNDRTWKNYDEKGRLIYTAYDVPKAVADISEMSYFSIDDIMYKLCEDPVSYCAVVNASYELDAEDILAADIFDDRVYYLDCTDEDDQTGDLIRINIEKNNLGKAECLGEDVTPIGIRFYDNQYTYFKDVETNRSGTEEGDLYVNGEYVDSDACVFLGSYNKHDDKVHYVTDYNQQKRRGELKCWKNGKTETLAEDVADSSRAGKDAGNLILGDFSIKRNKGTLYYLENGKSREIDDGVEMIVVPRRKQEE